MTMTEFREATKPIKAGKRVRAHVRGAHEGSTRWYIGTYQPDSNEPLILRIFQNGEMFRFPYSRVIGVEEVR